MDHFFCFLFIIFIIWFVFTGLYNHFNNIVKHRITPAPNGKFYVEETFFHFWIKVWVCGSSCGEERVLIFTYEEAENFIKRAENWQSQNKWP